LIDYLGDARLFGDVSAANGRRGEGVHLQPVLKRFERRLQADGQVDIAILLGIRVTTGKRGQPLLDKQYTARQPAKDVSMPASIRAFNAGLHTIYQRLTADLSELSSQRLTLERRRDR